jgi:hypothetical protein
VPPEARDLARVFMCRNYSSHPPLPRARSST